MTSRIAVFGGSFNPPHAAHQLVALYVLETQPVDELWFVPVKDHPFGKDLATFDHRIAMCELVAAPLGPRARVSRAEETLSGRTIDLLEHLAAPGRALRLVVGADILHEAAKWHRWDDVVARAPLIAIGRGGITPPAGSVVTGVTMPEISATRVRALLAAGDPAVGSLLTADVLRYIGTHQLYS